LRIARSDSLKNYCPHFLPGSDATIRPDSLSDDHDVTKDWVTAYPLGEAVRGFGRLWRRRFDPLLRVNPA